MDRREAIDILVGVIATNSEEENEAIDLAIEALGQPMVVYCRNCKHSKDTGDYQDTYFCDNPHHDSNHLVHSLEYCSHGKPKEKHQLSGETSTISENESVEDDLFNKSFWRMGMHDSNVRPRTMADTSTNEGDAESETTTDCISRADALEALTGWQTDLPDEYIARELNALPPVTPKEQTDCTDFINWLLEEVLDEENWELNAVANGEIICRKLKKLGLLEVKDGYYVRASVTPTERTGEWIER